MQAIFQVILLPWDIQALGTAVAIKQFAQADYA